MPIETEIGVKNLALNGLNGVLNVLVVDDEPDICLLLATALEVTGGYSVTAATGGREAREAIENAVEPFHGIFLDIQMPEISGIELCRIIRGMPGYSETPIIMLTAMTERRYLKDAFQEGADDYIIKPFNLDEIQTRLAKERTKSHRRARRLAGGETVMSSGQGAGSTKENRRSLHDSYTFVDVPRCVGVDAFHTYTKQFKVRFPDPLFIKTMKVNGVADLHARLSDAEFRELIRHVAQCISTATEKERNIFTYCGQGVFFSASESESTLTQGMLDETVAACGPSSDVTGQVPRLEIVLGPEDAYGVMAEPART